LPAKKKVEKKKVKAAAKVELFTVVQLGGAQGEPKIWAFDGRLNKVRNKPDRIVTGALRGKGEVPAGSATAPKGTFMIIGPIRPTARKPKTIKMDGWFYKIDGKRQFIISAAPLGGKKPVVAKAAPAKKAPVKAKKKARK
jgi:hypothetical protein